jgi:hypothetical protein
MIFEKRRTTKQSIDTDTFEMVFLDCASIAHVDLYEDRTLMGT